ncbi:MAG: hypothetical protein P4L79_15220 [Legionella sp.]|uniref:hypothetical protein n=1 Tax=Legionella sp. TaxID=459 RepID=UPI002846376E|nr:hypothetical protein [Legionella sp.]
MKNKFEIKERMKAGGITSASFATVDSGESGIEWRAGFGAVIDPQSKRCIDASVYLTKSPNRHILAEQVLPDILKPGARLFFSNIWLCSQCGRVRWNKFSWDES